MKKSVELANKLGTKLFAHGCTGMGNDQVRFDLAVRALGGFTILAPIRDPDFKGDAGRPEKKAPDGGWQKWLDEIAAKDAGYLKDYEVCHSGAQREARKQEPVDLFCMGGDQMRKDPAAAFQNTLRAAEQGYVPAEAALGMMYANGKGVQQNYAEAGKWWTKAAEGGHALATINAKMVPKGPAPAPKNAALSSH